MCRINLLLLLNIVLGGCVMGPKYDSPYMEIPCEWHSDMSEGMQTESPDNFLWWESLNDPVLTCLIERAALQNLDLFIAATRILEARVEEKGGLANLYPHIDGSATYGHVQYNQKMLNHILGHACPKNHHGSDKKNLNFFEFGFDAEWEIDLFGMQAHEINALKAQIQASTEEFCHLWITLAAEVAKNYIQLRSLQLRLQLIEKNILAQEESVVLTDSLIQAGFAGAIEEKQAEEQINTLLAQKPQIELSIDKAIHRLSVLLGYNPGELFNELATPYVLPAIPYEKPIGVPSELLRRRPDVRKAERDLAAATERVGSAVAAMFPRLSLRGFIGDLGSFHSNGFTWFAGSPLLIPLFNSKMLKQDVDYNKIKTQQALYLYQKVVLDALEEVENAIASFHYELERNGYLAQALKSSREAYELTNQLYQRGLKNYFEVLLANRSYLAVEEAYWQSWTELLIHYISLYKALGGGWDITECTIEEN